jgi:hypothetical protein
MNVNEKGNIGLIEVIRDLNKKGYECFLPLHDYSAVDLIVMDKVFQTKRIQVKYREFSNNIIDIGFNTVVNGKKIPIDLSAIDGWAVYIPEVDVVCYFSKEMIKEGNKGFRIRKIQGARTINIDKLQAPLYNNLVNEEVLWRVGRAV